MNLCVQTLAGTHAFVSLAYMFLGVDWLLGKCIFEVLMNCQSVFSSYSTVLHYHQQWMRGTVPCILTSLATANHFHFHHLIGMWWYLMVL